MAEASADANGSAGAGRVQRRVLAEDAWRMHDDAEPEDDWAPLRPEQLALRPGEVEASRPTPDAVAPAAPAAPVRPRRKPSAEGERAFAELQQRLLAMPPSDSIVAEMQRREQRATRRRDGRARAGEQLAATVVVVDESPVPPPEVPTLEFDEQHSELDARELEPWFLELPEAERERLRTAWAVTRHRHDWTSKAAKQRLLRGAAYGGLCFLILGVLMILLTGAVWQVPVFVVVGAICGSLATLCGGERFTYAAFGALGFLCVQGPDLLRNPFLMYGLLFAIAAMSVIGLDREMRRSAGCRDD